jgi:hypothetical protein
VGGISCAWVAGRPARRYRVGKGMAVEGVLRLDKWLSWVNFEVVLVSKLTNIGQLYVPELYARTGHKEQGKVGKHVEKGPSV